MKTFIVSAHECRGVYDGKPYSNGRLVIAHFDEKSRYPAYITVAKTSDELVKTLQGKTPLEAKLTYDAFKRVIGFEPLTERG